MSADQSTYNAYGLVRDIRNASGNLIEEYIYDDQGNRVANKIYDGLNLEKTVYYIHDAGGNVMAVYEQKTATTLIELPVYAEGRIATFKPVVNTYFYEVNDHLGNVRAVIGLTETDTYRATMESENVLLEEAPNPYPTAFFKNITSRRVTFVGANVTTNYTNSLGAAVTGNEVVRVNNSAPAGPGISLKVSPGDKINAEVWAYYEAGSAYNSMISVATMVNAIAGAFGGVSGGAGESGQIYNAINSGVGSYIGSGAETTQPAAYLQYIVYDANLNPTGQKGYFRVSTASNMAKAKVTMPQITIEQPGYIYIFVYNRSNSTNWVYFDEMLVTHEHSKIVAGADYYPFGLAMDGREITDEAYRWGYQGQYAEKDSITGWNEFQLRMYDARFGRWLSPDPYGQFSSPYTGMGNAPHMSVDPDGGYVSGFVRYGIAFGVGAVIGGAGGVAAYAGISNAGAIGNAVGNVGKGVGNSGLLQPLTTTLLRQIAINEGVSPEMPRFNQIVGAAFEEAGLANFGLTKNTQSFSTPDRALNGGLSKTIPDGVRDVTVYDSRTRKRTVYRNSSFFEAKAVNGTLNLSYEKHQILGILEAARNSPGARAGRANVTFVTTANTVIGADVIAYASRHGISVHQSVAFQWGEGNNVVFSPTVELTPGTSLSIPTPSIFAWPRSLNFRH